MTTFSLNTISRSSRTLRTSWREPWRSIFHSTIPSQGFVYVNCEINHCEELHADFISVLGIHSRKSNWRIYSENRSNSSYRRLVFTPRQSWFFFPFPCTIQTRRKLTDFRTIPQPTKSSIPLTSASPATSTSHLD